MTTVVVRNILWSGERGGAVFNAVTDEGKSFRLVASAETMPRVPIPGEAWCVSGKLVNHPEYGQQVQVVSAELQRPTGRLIMRTIADSAEFRGLGESRARRLWEAFGSDLYRLLAAGDPSPFAGVVGDELANILVKGWEKLALDADVYLWLDRHGVSPWLASRLIAIYGNRTIEKLEDNPYRLLAFVGWTTADKVARAMGIALTDERRLVGAADAIVYRRLQHSNTWAERESFTADLRNLARCGTEAARQAVSLALKERAIVEMANGVQGLGPASMERFIAERIWNLVDSGYALEQFAARRSPDTEFLSAFFERCNRCYQLTLNPEQRQAVEVALSSPVSVICGGAGVGKTTVLKAIVEASEMLGGHVHMMALSGRAARKMSEATGREARTIASFLKAVDRNEIKLDGEPMLAIDEASMLDLPTTYRLLRRLGPCCRLLLLGDPGQLPPIGFGLVFHALVELNMVSVVELTEVHRQAAETGIPMVSLEIRAGAVPELVPYSGLGVGVSFVDCGLPDVTDIVRAVVNDLGGFSKTQVITPVKSGPAGTLALNQFFHGSFRIGRPVAHGYAEGEPVIWTKNDYDRGLMNGSLGIVKAVAGEELLVGWDEGEMLIDDVANMSLAYAITIHKAQGSQWERVVVPVFESRLLDRTLLYTAITRAQYQVVLVGARQAFEQAVTAPPSHSLRETGMRYHLEQANKKKKARDV